MNMTPCLWLFSALSASSVPRAAALLNEIAADSRIHTGTSRAYGTHATQMTDAWREPTQAPAPVPLQEHALAVSLMQAFPGVSAAESTVYRHIRDNPDMSGAEQESLQQLLGDACPMIDYLHLGESLILGLTAAGPDAKHTAAAREAIIANALRDVQRQPHALAMLVHARLIGLLQDNGWLKHVKAAASVAHARALAVALQQVSQQPAPDIRTQVIQAEPLRDALLTFLLAEASV